MSFSGKGVDARPNLKSVYPGELVYHQYEALVWPNHANVPLGKVDP